MLERFPGSPALDERPQRFEFRFAQWTIEFEIKVHPLFPEGVRQQVLDIEARVFHAVLLKERRGGLDDFEDVFNKEAI